MFKNKLFNRGFILLIVDICLIISCTTNKSDEKDLIDKWNKSYYFLYDSTYKISSRDYILEIIKIDYPYHKNDSSIQNWYNKQIEIFNTYKTDSIIVSKGLFEFRRNQNTEGEKLGKLKRWR